MHPVRTSSQHDLRRARPRSGLVVLAYGGGRAFVESLADDPLIRSVHVEADSGRSLRAVIEKLKPDVVVTTPPDLAAASRAIAEAGVSPLPLVTVASDADPCPVPPRGTAFGESEFVTLPAVGGRLGKLLQQICLSSHGESEGRRPERSLLVTPKAGPATLILHALLGGDPAIAPLLVDSVDVARRWLRWGEFDCAILAHGLHDGHGVDCMEGFDPGAGTPAIGVHDAQDVHDVAQFFRDGCVDVLTSVDLRSRRTIHRRVREAIAREEVKKAKTSQETGRLLDLLAREQEELITAARSDRLTGVLNRAAFEEVLKDMHDRSAAGEPGYAMIVFDIDHFKTINDRCGHQRGDEVLRLAARTMGEALGERGMLARIGGEEFAALCPACSPGLAMNIAEDIRLAVEAASPPDMRLTISGGIASAPSPEAPTVQNVYSLADSALYKAKAAGRNRIIAA